MNVQFNTARTLITAALVLASAGFLRAHQNSEVFPQRVQLDQFPRTIEGLEGRDLPIDETTARVLGPGEFLSRNYIAKTVGSVNLFIGYFPSQKAGNSIHSPLNCLPGAGWVPANLGRAAISVPGGRPLYVNRYIISQGGTRQFVVYWYQSHGRSIPSEYWAKFYQVVDSIRMNRTDAALIRIIIPITPGDGIPQVEARSRAFASAIETQIHLYIPD